MACIFNKSVVPLFKNSSYTNVATYNIVKGFQVIKIMIFSPF
jgi:hypothetical protein